MIFETERLIVRKYAASEFESFFLINGNAEVVRYIRPVQERPEALTLFQQMLTSYADSPEFGRWAVFAKQDKEFVGSFGIIPIPWEKQNTQLGYALLPQYWGRGYATELTRAGIQYFWRKSKDEVLYAMTETENQASQKVLLKCGFVFEKKAMDKDKEILVYNQKRFQLQ